MPIVMDDTGNTKMGRIIVLLTSCLTGLGLAVCRLTIFVFICKTDSSKPVKQEVNGTVILPPLVFPGWRHFGATEELLDLKPIGLEPLKDDASVTHLWRICDASVTHLWRCNSDFWSDICFRWHCIQMGSLPSSIIGKTIKNWNGPVAWGKCYKTFYDIKVVASLMTIVIWRLWKGLSDICANDICAKSFSPSPSLVPFPLT